MMQVNAKGATPAAGPASPQAKTDLEKTAKAFEAIFLRQMISTMRSASLGDGLTDNDATQQFRDMSDSRTADNMAETGGFGVAELLMRQLGPKAPATPVAKAPAS